MVSPVPLMCRTRQLDTRFGIIYNFRITSLWLLSSYTSQDARTAKWAEMLSAWEKFSKDEPAKIKRRVRKGIPDSMRRSAWNALTKMALCVKHVKANPPLP